MTPNVICINANYGLEISIVMRKTGVRYALCPLCASWINNKPRRTQRAQRVAYTKYMKNYAGVQYQIVISNILKKQTHDSQFLPKTKAPFSSISLQKRGRENYFGLFYFFTRVLKASSLTCTGYAWRRSSIQRFSR